ncbi:helix-turn-helix transcriptional regulator [Tuanshanicoccus lijuaniae]|uniref:helix-turn-helix transcriptional regulator n=1 Tax=Aerococcaceae bacterium zg-1292 TaxID=2774330 RepID=UPI0019362BDD|nr:helix-turn-helix transcriptional regulator [Aerococcaceae bacterium zg-1292]MBF6626409.1 helix-turn-helix transcriptional regulator [Aerococcaceae bacterium zg-BR9]MBS4455718.1 helix-turn-helix transcriptional regulator [Aerococcaceae bacterium zg-A91]MBS4457469.1 helix-turn-helix transcriptional regulator [Aerococcaceae bacterium zg-BR33]QQA37087.1 helix-turn-helix transcriptional regulator [Aerococcaceae bacterium zg-1292]
MYTKLSQSRTSYIEYLQREKTTLANKKEFFQKASKTNSPSSFLSEYQLYNSEYDREHTPYANEIAMMTAISNGDLDAYLKAAEYSTQQSLGQLSTSFSKSLEYQCVIGISLFARATIRGGVDPYIAYNLNDLFLQRISECNDVDSFLAVMEHALHTFIDEVNNFKKSDSTPAYIEKAKQYIRNHISKPFSIQDIADSLDISKEHLMRQFHRYTGYTISKSIHHERIHAAQNMLIFSDFSIGQISNYLQYPSQSYFGRIFKEIVGCTPREFQRRNHLSTF